MASPFVSRLLRVSASAALALSTVGCIGLTELDREVEKMQEKDDVEVRKAHFEESAQTYYDGGKYAQSVVQWRRVLEIEPKRPKAKWGLAKSLAMVGTPATLRESEQIYTEIIDWDWMHPTLGDRRGDILKDFAEVYSSLADFYDEDSRVLQARLDAKAPDEAALRQNLQRQLAARNTLLAKAIPLYQQALEKKPDHPPVLAGLSKSYLMLGDDPRGIEYARRYIAISRTSQSGWDKQLKAFQEERQKDGGVTDEQRKWFQDKIRGARDKEMKLHLLLGSVLIRNHDYAGAIAEYDRVLEIDPAMPAAYLERAQAYGMSRQYRKAIADLEQYLKITDPVSQRRARVNAADLLDKYRLSAAAEPR